MVISRLIDKSQQDGDLEVDLLAGLDRQEEAEERDEEDEEARRDEVDDVEEAAAAHVDRERHVRVHFRAAGVRLLVPISRDTVVLVHRPFLHNAPWTTPCSQDQQWQDQNRDHDRQNKT